MKYKWHIKGQDEIPRDLLHVAFGSEVVARLLLNRGINTTGKAKTYLEPKFYKESNPEEIPNLISAKERIIQAIDKKEKITIFGDYDVDGITGTSCLLITLKKFTDNVDFYIPNRLTEGYGLNNEAVKEIAKNKTKLLITCDCGITNHCEIETAKKLGMDVIVTDHHSLPETLPDACAVLNPKLLPEDHKLHFLPGVGVAFKLAEALGALKEDLLDLVTLGMIADLAPLVQENRYLVQIGLPKLRATEKIGLRELLRVCGYNLYTETTTEHVGFGIAPRINAIGRLSDAKLGVLLLTTNDIREAVHIANELDLQNKERQKICELTLLDAVSLVHEQVDFKKDRCIILAKENWHHGILGIVASRIVEKFGLPTILIGIDKEQNIARGSGRSIETLNIIEAVSSCSKHLERFGGHKAACGVSLKVEKIDEFLSNFKTTVNNLITSDDLGLILHIDCPLSTSSLNLDLINKINRLAPFGLQNPMPLFESEEVEIAGIRNIGREKKHLKLMLKTAPQHRSSAALHIYEALIWNHDNNIQFNIGEKVKIAYTPKLNTYNGETFIQLEIKDYEKVETRILVS